MSISINTNSLLNYNALANTTNQTQKLEQTLNSGIEDSTDEELMEACKSFESYFVEQVFKEMRKTVQSSDENEYTEYFGDMLYQEYSDNIVESESLGIAQMLYESMKR